MTLKEILEYVLIFVAGSVGTVWLLMGAPIPQASIQPLEPSAELPTFSSVSARHTNLTPQARAAREYRKKLEANDGEDSNPEHVNQHRRGLTRHLNRSARAIIKHSAAYQNDQCNSKYRRELVGDIHLYLTFSRDMPSLELSTRNGMSDEAVKEAISQLFRMSLLNYEDFWQTVEVVELLEPFTQERNPGRASQIIKCQNA